MNIRSKAQAILNIECDVLILFVIEDQVTLSDSAQTLDSLLNGALTAVSELGDFTGKKGQSHLLYTRGVLPASRLLLVGVGQENAITTDTLRRTAATAVRKAREMRTKIAAVLLTDFPNQHISISQAAQAVAEGSLLGGYEYRGQKSTEAPPETGLPETLDLVVVDAVLEGEAQAGLSTGMAFAAGGIIARDLANLPPNICTPAYLAQHARDMAESTGLTCEILEEQQMRALRMGALLAVAQGSAASPRFIILEHNASHADQMDTLVLIGKGVTFDTGGYSIKTSEGMVGMKGDMAGAAAVIGAMGTIAALNLPLHVVGLVPAADNMISGNAYRPQEVITAGNGKTIEIISTDAEGRLLLADALVFATKYAPTAVVDIATLTGACVIALGKAAAGLFATTDTLRDRLLQAGDAAAERVWPLPMFAEYDKLLESDTADMKNSSGGRFAGASVGAVFLKNFIDYPAWAHIDMAGMMADIEGVPYIPSKGASGYGARLLAEFARQWAEQAMAATSSNTSIG